MNFHQRTWNLQVDGLSPRFPGGTGFLLAKKSGEGKERGRIGRFFLMFFFNKGAR